MQSKTEKDARTNQRCAYRQLADSSLSAITPKAVHISPIIFPASQRERESAQKGFLTDFPPITRVKKERGLRE